MNFLKYELNASVNEVVEVELSSQANVRLLDATNFRRFQRGERHEFYGGLAKVSPIRIPVPRTGHWYVVVDLGGYAGSVRANVRLLAA